MTSKNRHFMAAGAFILIFGGLLALATIFDLQVSFILAEPNLGTGRYFSTNFMCNLVEVAAMVPIWGFATFAAAVLTVFFRQQGGPMRLLQILFFGLSVFAGTFLLRDMMKYLLQIQGREEIMKQTWFNLLMVAFGLLVTVLILGLAGGWIRAHMRQLLPFALAIICSCCCFLFVELIKNPVGRMRFRAMHFIDDYSYYTPWYQVSSARAQLGSLGFDRDYFKSFPSGHTFSGSMIYLVILLPDLFRKLQTRKGKILSYVVPIVYTGFVAFFRIAAGAHFFSDVLVGGTMGFLAVQFFRYIFLYRLRERFGLEVS
ncbi:MAG: phosphatase PAP2 family protein [Acetatifactor sp.]|nr:phosphatase PAP2 family protein [Acetatifactor sp.]